MMTIEPFANRLLAVLFLIDHTGKPRILRINARLNGPSSAEAIEIARSQIADAMVKVGKAHGIPEVRVKRAIGEKFEISRTPT